MQYLSVEQVIELHRRVVRQSGGSLGIRDQGSLESTVMQPLQAFGAQDLYPSLVEKAAALGYFLIQNHPFVDGTSEWVMPRWKLCCFCTGRKYRHRSTIRRQLC